MNVFWSTNPKNVLCDSANKAENRLKAIKKAVKTFKATVEESLRTATKRQNENVDVRKRRTQEFVCGEKVAQAVSTLTEEGKREDLPISALNTVMERFATFEKNIGHMLAANEIEITTFLLSDTPMSKLLNKDIPAVTAAKTELEQLNRKHLNVEQTLERETNKLRKLASEIGDDHDAIVKHEQQEEKTRRLKHEVESLAKDITLERDKLTNYLLTLVSRENHYASSVVELMRIKKQFYANAFNAINAELPAIERILQETKLRPVFGEDLDDHLCATERKIAFPIALSVTFLRQSGLEDEGLFRIAAQQIKLDKLKAHLDAGLTYHHLLKDCDVHFFAALLKNYLRELPVPLLGRKEGHVHDRWVEVPALPTKEARVKEIRYILKEDLPSNVVINIQYLVKMLAELTKKSDVNKMTTSNLGIVIGPSLLWKIGGSTTSQQNNIEKVIKVVSMLVEHYAEIFPVDLHFSQYDEGIIEILEKVRQTPSEGTNNLSKTAKQASVDDTSYQNKPTKAQKLKSVFTKN